MDNSKTSISTFKSLFSPQFPNVGSTPPTLKDIESSSPNKALMLWGSISCLLVVVGIYFMVHMHASNKWVLLPIALAIFFSGFFFMLAHIASFKFEAIEYDSGCRWTCDSVHRFFRDNPEFSPYHRDVVQQGRSFFTGEMDTLLKKSEASKKSRDCIRLYQINL